MAKTHKTQHDAANKADSASPAKKQTKAGEKAVTVKRLKQSAISPKVVAKQAEARKPADKVTASPSFLQKEHYH